VSPYDFVADYDTLAAVQSFIDTRVKRNAAMTVHFARFNRALEVARTKQAKAQASSIAMTPADTHFKEVAYNDRNTDELLQNVNVTQSKLDYFLSNSAETIAQQLTLMDFCFLAPLKIEQLLLSLQTKSQDSSTSATATSSSSPSSSSSSSRISIEFVEWSIRMVALLLTELCKSGSNNDSKKISVVEKYIDTALALLKLHNFEGAARFVAVLASPWCSAFLSLISVSHRNQLSELMWLFDARADFAAYRDRLEQSVRKFDEKDGTLPIIPIAQVWMRDFERMLQLEPLIANSMAVNSAVATSVNNNNNNNNQQSPSIDIIQVNAFRRVSRYFAEMKRRLRVADENVTNLNYVAPVWNRAFSPYRWKK
jgi:hypothetical protein